VYDRDYELAQIHAESDYVQQVSGETYMSVHLLCCQDKVRKLYGIIRFS